MQIAYAIALFLHVMGAISLFIGVGIELAVFVRLRRAATMEQVRDAVWYENISGRWMSIASVLILFAGLYMLVTTWGLSSAWIDTSIPLFFVLAGLGGGVNARHGVALAKAVAAVPDGSIPADIQALIFDPLYNAGVMIMSTTAVGIVFLMTVKPNLAGSLVAAVIALVAGILVGLSVRRPTVQASVPSAPRRSASR
jgi:hypothetical protein